ncbi:nitronate monooxygenase [Clostridium sp. KNHs216]|uniref:NAD(P)H-dependent flavin oxidoreductase n=1 Tax=Clostridium sp. KNHs216 TaxID=1550235 RepID=UPI0011727D90|nr:nitronate monooxygenase [Clostridium sp. KNHs216]TQI68036.1 nitronate monooxygenase [Clostridium sp. KNHs216]
MIKTKMTELFGIQYPIMQGGMQHLGVPELAAAVSEAGGLGTINVTIFPEPENLRAAIRKTKSLTNKPFAVNLSLIPSLRPGKDLFQQVDVMMEEGVAAIETAGASPKELAEVLAANKDRIKWIHKAACVKHAKKAESLGADLVTIAGFEVAGHPYKDEVGTIVLSNRTSRELTVPVLAAGGITDGRGLVAALALGCEGVVMGTRFVASKECWIHENFKNWIVNAEEADTAICQRTINNMVRVANNGAAKKCLEMEAQGATLEQLMSVISGKKGHAAYESGDIDGGMFGIGPAIGLIHDIPSVKEIIDGMVAEADAVLARLSAMNA